MAEDLHDTIKRRFDIATYRKLGRTLSVEDWTKVQDVTAAAELARKAESKRHTKEYDERFFAARKQIIDERASKQKTLKPRFVGHDLFDKQSINRLAHKRVAQFHELQLSLIERREAKALRQIAKSAHANAPKKSFSRAADPVRNKPRSRDR